MPSRESDDEGQRIDLVGPTAVGDAVASARRYALDRGLGPRDQARLGIIVEELVTNLFEHGGCDGSQPILIELAHRGSGITLVIEDRGVAFDPRSLSDESNVPERGGGTGLRLIRAWSEIVSYDSGSGVNRLELSVPLTGG